MVTPNSAGKLGGSTNSRAPLAKAATACDFALRLVRGPRPRLTVRYECAAHPTVRRSERFFACAQPVHPRSSGHNEEEVAGCPRGSPSSPEAVLPDTKRKRLAIFCCQCEHSTG